MPSTPPSTALHARWKECPPLVPLEVEGPLSLYWSHPAWDVCVAGFGVAAEGPTQVHWEGAAPSSLPAWEWGGWAFVEKRAWPGWPSQLRYVPQTLVWKVRGECGVATFGDSGRVGPFFGRVEPVTQGSARRASPPPGLPDWNALVKSALDGIARGAFTKVVVARPIEVECDQTFDVRRVLGALEREYPTCRTFLVRSSSGEAFLGSSPELLADVHLESLETEALAGSLPVSRASELLGDERLCREHGVVVEGIGESLAPLSVEFDTTRGARVKVLPNIAHLCTPIYARLRDGVAAQEAARALHPTAATAGVPRKTAMDWLSTHEGFDRGWYAGAVGCWTPTGGTWAVGLRCALVSGRRARIFVGAGIVAGSSPDAEYEETQAKAEPLLKALGVTFNE